MKTSVQSIRRTAVSVAGLALVAGGVHAAWGVWSRPWVREFQAGAASPTAERLLAVLQQTAIEVVGFGALAVVLAVFAAVLTALRRPSPAERPGETAASFLLVTGAFVAWVLDGTWLAEAALPFLAPAPLALVNLGGLAVTLLGFFVLDWLMRRVPWGTRSKSATALVGAVGLCLAVHFARFAITRGSGGYKDPLRVAQCAGYVLLVVALAPFVAARIAAPMMGVVARLARGPLLPAPVRLTLGLLLVACVVGAAPSFELSPVPTDVSYPELSQRGSPRGPNVVLVTIDTLRNDHLGCYGYERPTSPHIDAVAAEGVVCEDPSAAASWTKPATGTILTGLHPSRHGALYHGSALQLPPGERTLAEAFRDAGYVTAGFVSNPNIKKVFEFDRGFDEYFDSPVEDTVTLASIRSSWFGRVLMKLARHQFNWKYENDVDQMNRHILSWLDRNRDNRFFLYLHYIDPHIPYEPPQPYRSQFVRDHGLVLFNERKEKVGIDLYDAEIRFVDQGIGDLVERLKKVGAWDDTLFVLTSDHGEEFFEHGVLGHGFSLYQPVIGVPLILHGPGVPAGRRVTEPVQVLDMPATVLELAGTGDTRLGDGTSFASLVRGGEPGEPRMYFLESEFGQDEHDTRSFVFNGVREGRWKLVLTEANAYFPPQNPKYGSQALYDLENDPEEEHNLVHDPQYKDLVRRLVAELTRHAEFLQETGFRDHEPAALDEATQEELRALGYL